MSDKYKEARQEGLECGLSLAKAMQDAGGSISTTLLKMTLEEFICTVAAQNNIRFVYGGEREEFPKKPRPEV